MNVQNLMLEGSIAQATLIVVIQRTDLRLCCKADKDQLASPTFWCNAALLEMSPFFMAELFVANMFLTIRPYQVTPLTDFEFYMCSWCYL